MKSKGFTIVELLIVIVVIAILAAITIVAYNGISSRAKASSAESAAASISKKSEIYNVDPATVGYPATLTALTGAASTASYYIDAASLAPAATLTSSTASLEKAVIFKKCGHNGTTTAPTTAAGITSQTGVRVEFWNVSAVDFLSTGQVSGSVGTFPVACIASNT